MAGNYGGGTGKQERCTIGRPMASFSQAPPSRSVILSRRSLTKRLPSRQMLDYFQAQESIL